MSRVTINDICNMDYGTSRNKVLDVEVVPRKIVEKIIERCEWVMDFYNQDTEFAHGKRTSADDIRAYAESLLMEFEEDDQ